MARPTALGAQTQAGCVAGHEQGAILGLAQGQGIRLAKAVHRERDSRRLSRFELTQSDIFEEIRIL
jgi:hypothetical protein